MEAFFVIVMSYLLISNFIRKEVRALKRRRHKAYYTPERACRMIDEWVEQDKIKAKEAKEKQYAEDKRVEQRNADIAELKKQGYTDELIAVILPTIENGQ